VLVLLDEPVVQAHLSPRALLQLQHKVEALKAELVAVVRGEQAANSIFFEALEPEAGMQLQPAVGVHHGSVAAPAAAVGAQALPGTAAGLSLQQLAAHCDHGGSSQLLNALTPLRCIAKMLYGSDFDADAVQVFELLQHWDEFEEQLQPQVAGTHPTLPTLQAVTALRYTCGVVALLEEPVLQAQLTPATLQQLHKKVSATKAAMKAVRTAVKQEQATGHKRRRSVGVLEQTQSGKLAESAQHITAQDSSVAGATGAAGSRMQAPQATASAVRAQLQGSTTPAAGLTAPMRAAGSWMQAPQATASAQLQNSTTPAAAAPHVAAGAPAACVTPAAAPGPSEHSLPAAQQLLLRLYQQKLTPSLSEKVALRSTMQMLAALPPGDVRLDRFWADYDVSVYVQACMGSGQVPGMLQHSSMLPRFYPAGRLCYKAMAGVIVLRFKV
jgi:hypothetical protein